MFDESIGEDSDLIEIVALSFFNSGTLSKR